MLKRHVTLQKTGIGSERTKSAAEKSVFSGTTHIVAKIVSHIGQSNPVSELYRHREVTFFRDLNSPDFSAGLLACSPGDAT